MYFLQAIYQFHEVTSYKNKKEQDKQNNQRTGISKVETVENTPIIESTLTKKEKFIKTAKTLAPIVIPLAAIPISVFVSYKLTGKRTKKVTEEIYRLSSEISKLKNEFGNVKTTLTDAGEKIAQQSATVTKLNNKVIKLSALIAGGVLTYNAGKSTGKNEEEKISYYNNLINNTQLNYDPTSPPQEIKSVTRTYKKVFTYEDLSKTLTKKQEDSFVKKLIR